MMKRIFAAAALAAIVIGSIAGAEARQWKPTKAKLTLDYLQIMHYRAENEIVFLQWMAPSLFENTPTYDQARELTSKYVILLMVHAKVDATGQWSYTTPDNVAIETAGQRISRPIPQDKLPGTVFGFVSAVSRVIAQGLGPMGRRMVAMVYPAGDISVCEKGGFWVQYGGERYEYETPIPGCANATQTRVESKR